MAPNFVVIDCETTGLGKYDRVLEVAAVTVNSDTLEVVDEYDTLINPQRDVGPFGQQRNKNLEALGRGQHQFMGIAANTVVFALIAASYNLRALRNWNNQQPNPIDDHPLLVDIEEGIIGSENHDSAA